MSDPTSENKTALLSDDASVLVSSGQMIADAYQRHQGRSELEVFKRMVREGRKFGFPLVFILDHYYRDNHYEDEKLKHAAKLLLQVVPTWSSPDIPEDFQIIPNSQLHHDAMWLLDNTMASSFNLKHCSQLL
jgi:hypothetical protein